MSKVHIICPSCSQNKFIEISEENLKNTQRGLITVNIPKELICSHSFIVYIDKNLNIRDYFITDFKLDLPELHIDSSEMIKNIKISEKEDFDLDLIKLNIPAMQLTYILKSIFLKQKMVLLIDQSFIHEHIYNFLKNITQNSFKIDIIIMTEKEYKNKKNLYKDSMVFQSINILRNFKKLIKLKKLDVEKHIVNIFFSERDSDLSFIVLKNEILKAFILSKKIVDLINEYKEKKEIVNILKIRLKLEEVYNIKINTIYLNFLINIVENYYGVKVLSIIDSFLIK